ncbi:hypothetical protein DFS34DRAFT_594241 [Phlyctochytrium arcticum]|nr:hypothetical protein DFS34DRAFT_594241 [Phlyctochytrium arcticum]
MSSERFYGTKSRRLPRVGPSEELVASPDQLQATEGKKGLCDCRLLYPGKIIPIHYHSTQKQCLLHGKSAAAKRELQRRIAELRIESLPDSSDSMTIQADLPALPAARPTTSFCKTCTSRGHPPNVAHHTRTSSKLCPYHKPKLASRKQKKAISYSTRTVKMGLLGFLRAPQLLPVIRDFVGRMTRIHFEAARLANLYVIDQLEQGNVLGDLSYNPFMRQTFQGVLCDSEGAPKVVANSSLLDTRDRLYAPQRPAGFAENLCSKLSQSCGTAMGFAHGQVRRRVGEAFLAGSIDPPMFTKLTPWQQCMLAIVHRSLARQCQDEFIGGIQLPMDISEFADKCWELLPSLWRLNRFLEANGRRGFTMLPLTSARAQFVEFDTDALYYLLRANDINMPRMDQFRLASSNPGHLPPAGTYPLPTQPDALVCDHWWFWAFHLGKVMTAADTAGQRRFACSLATDGMSVSVSVQVAKPKFHPNPVNEYGFDEEGTYHPMVERQGHRG